MALSDWDKKHLNSQQQRAVITYTQQYDAAIKEGNKDKARMAHEGAEAIRRQAGYSGGDAGNSFLPAAQTTTKTTSTTKNGNTTYQTTQVGSTKGYDNGSLSTEQVKQLQKALGVAQDGYFGPQTQAAAFQRWGASGADAAMNFYKSTSVPARTSFNYDEDEGTYRWNGQTFTTKAALTAAMNKAGLTAAEKEIVNRKAQSSGSGVRLLAGEFGSVAPTLTTGGKNPLAPGGPSSTSKSAQAAKQAQQIDDEPLPLAAPDLDLPVVDAWQRLTPAQLEREKANAEAKHAQSVAAQQADDDPLPLAAPDLDSRSASDIQKELASAKSALLSAKDSAKRVTRKPKGDNSRYNAAQAKVREAQSRVDALEKELEEANAGTRQQLDAVTQQLKETRAALGKVAGRSGYEEHREFDRLTEQERTLESRRRALTSELKQNGGKLTAKEKLSEFGTGVADLVDSVLSGGDSAWGGVYGALTMADEATGNAARGVMRAVTGDEKYDEPFVSPFRETAQYHNEKAADTLQRTTEGRSDLGRQVMSTGQAAGNMLAMSSLGALMGGTGAGMGATFATSEAGLGAGAAQQAATKLVNLGARIGNEIFSHSTNALISAGSAGHTYLNATDRGADQGKAMANAIGSGLLEYFSNKMFSGTPLEDTGEKGYVTQLIEYAADRLGKSEALGTFLSSALGKGTSVVFDKLGEGFEEVITAIGDPILERLTWNPEADMATVNEIVDAFASGLALSLFMSGGEAVIDNAARLGDSVRGAFNNGAAAQSVDTDGGAGMARTEAAAADHLIPAANMGAEARISPQSAQMQNAASGGEAAQLPRMSMADFANTDSPVWNNVEYGDTDTQQRLMRSKHQEMVDAGEVVTVPEAALNEVAQAYPDLRGMKKSERTPILKQKMGELKTTLRNMLNGLKGAYEFEVNGNVLEARLYDTGVREVMQNITQPKAAMLTQSGDIFRNAQYLYSTPDYEGNPNIYRWNYFYSPVQIGDQTVGVRIAVRDMVPSADGRMDSQIYHWGIKEDAPLGGGRPGTNPNATGVSSDASTVGALGGGSPRQSPLSSDASSATTVDENTIAQPSIAVKSSAVSDLDTAAVDALPLAAPDLEDPDIPADGPLSNTVGSAQVGFMTPDSVGETRTSRLKDRVLEYNRHRGDASGMDRETYDQIFKYQSLTTEQMNQAADDLLYVEQNGQRTFLMDYDPKSYQEITDQLREAPAWNGPMTKAAKMIEQELMRRSLDMEVSDDVYNEWRQVMRDHSTAGGQGVQAWDDPDNRNGQKSETKAWDDITNNKHLTDAEKKALMRKIILWDEQIRTADNAPELKRIIMEVAAERGTVANLTGKQSKILYGIANQALDGLTTDQLRQFAYNSTGALATDNTPANVGQKLKTIQVLNMLSNPKTAAKNLAGNTSFYLIDALAMRSAAVLDMGLSKITGTRSVAFENSLLAKETRDTIQKAIQMSLAEVTLDVDMGGESRYGNTSNRTFKSKGAGVINTNTGLDRFAERALSAAERNMGYLLTTSDEAFKGAARGANEGAMQRLIDNKKIKTQNENYAAEQADALARYRTFQQDGKAAAVIQGLHDLGNLIGVGDSGKKIGKLTVHNYGLGDKIAPFTRVAANLAATGLDYSPVGAAKGAVEIVDTIHKALTQPDFDPTRQAKALSDLTRGLTGTAIAYGFMVLAKAGVIRRADDEDDKDIAKLNAAEGLTGTQFNLDAAKRALNGGSTKWQSGDTLLDLMNFEPLNALISLGVSLANDDPDGGLLTTITGLDPEGLPEGIAKTDSVITDTLMNTASAAGELPMLSSIGNFARDVMVYNENPFAAAFESFGKNVISSYTPNIVASAARGIDEKQRNLYTGDSVLDSLGDYAKSRIPFLRNTLPTVTDVTGAEKENAGGLAGRLFNAMLNPVGVNEYTQSEISQEMQRIREETGDASFYPTTRQPKKIEYTDGDGNKQEIRLSYEERQQYQADASNTQMSMTAALMNSRYYSQLDDEQKAEALRGIQQYANAKAKKDLIAREGDEYNMTGQARTIEKALDAGKTGIDLAQYMLLKKVHDDIDDGEGTAVEKATRFALYLKGTNLTQTQQDTIMDLLTYSSGFKAEVSDKALAAVDAGIDIGTWETYHSAISAMEADKDANGKTISGSKKAKVVEYIASMNITAEQKDMLYLAEKYSEKELANTPWHTSSASPSRSMYDEPLPLAMPNEGFSARDGAQGNSRWYQGYANAAPASTLNRQGRERNITGEARPIYRREAVDSSRDISAKISSIEWQIYQLANARRDSQMVDAYLAKQGVPLMAIERAEKLAEIQDYDQQIEMLQAQLQELEARAVPRFSEEDLEPLPLAAP